MTFWVVRAGKHGEAEAYAVENNCVVVGWDDLEDFSAISDRDALQQLVTTTYPDETIGTVRVWTGELWAFRERVQTGDWIAIPLKSRSALAVGRVTGPYRYVATAPAGAYHQRPVQWVRTDLPRSDVDQDLLYSLGSTLTVFRVQRNNAEERLAALVQRKAATSRLLSGEAEESEQYAGELDLEQFAADQVAKYISRKFRGHELARLVAAILAAEGYQVQVARPGADGGVDIIAGTGPMGFGDPRIAVQVKSGDTPSDVSVLRELQGVMPRFGAQHGLIVSWPGFKESVIREARQLFFEVRLWDAGDLVTALQNVYSKLPEDLQAELPLKRIWLLVEE
jgi:restriction system protein